MAAPREAVSGQARYPGVVRRRDGTAKGMENVKGGFAARAGNQR